MENHRLENISNVWYECNKQVVVIDHKRIWNCSKLCRIIVGHIKMRRKEACDHILMTILCLQRLNKKKERRIRELITYADSGFLSISYTAMKKDWLDNVATSFLKKGGDFAAFSLICHTEEMKFPINTVNINGCFCFHFILVFVRSVLCFLLFFPFWILGTHWTQHSVRIHQAQISCCDLVRYE